MASKVKIELNSAAVRSLLRSSEMLEDLRSRAQRIANAAGEGMEANAAVGPNRARASVVTATFEARHREATRRALTSAIDAGR